MVVMYVCIDGYDLPVVPGPVTKVFFSGDCKERDKPEGFWDFWTMERTQGKPKPGRFRAGGYPGQRFEKTNLAQTGKLIRPTSGEELQGWLNHPYHAEDAPCAQHGELNGQPIRIRRVAGHYIVEATTSPGK